MVEKARSMTKGGVGPKWAVLSIIFSAPFIVVRLLWPEVVAVPLVPRPLVAGVGIALLAVGIPICIAAVVRLARGFPRGELFTGGVYSLCRHPIYGSWIVFNVPGIVLLADNWVGLLSTIPMYITLRVLVREEERWLEETFGDEYRAYRARVPAVLPIGWFRR